MEFELRISVDEKKLDKTAEYIRELYPDFTEDTKEIVEYQIESLNSTGIYLDSIEEL